MKDTIFYLEGRGGQFLYHFIIYNIGALFYIENKKYDISYKDSVKINNNNLVKYPSNNIISPYYIYCTDLLEFQKEAFDILKDKFILLEKLPNINYEIISMYGESNKKNSYSDNKLVIPYIRKLFLDRLNYKNKNKRIFITRQHFNNHNYKRRVILNEDNFCEMLKKYNFEYIKLEDYSFKDKIKLFMESSIIISTHGSQLTFSLFINNKTKIIEILNKGTNGFYHDHNKFICNSLNLNYYRYSNINEDKNGNFNINIEEFEKYIKNLI